MFRFRLALVAAAFLLSAAPVASAGDGNRLTYLEENNPWYPHTGFARLTTPQWVGDEGVEAVVILAIDDMRDPAKYEAFLRPILQRLKAIDGRAPVSIMTCNVKPDDPQLQSWLGEGLSIECHTVDHPCPLLQGGDFEKAKSTYDRCVDTLNQIPGNTPVAFRTPCCDSLNTVSPRFFAEIFNSRTPDGNFLQMDSSVFCVFTEDDPDIPAELVTDPDGKPKFRKYLPTGLERNGVVHNEFVNWIENYPYPYVINGTCWEIPCMAPSDWEANFYHQPNNPQTVRDMETALDITVLKQGEFCMVFHPHGWIRAEQIVEFIDHAVETYGEKVKFLTFPEALTRLNENLLDEHPLRDEQGLDNCVRVLDIDHDGWLDVVTGGTGPMKSTKVWVEDRRTWEDYSNTPLILQRDHANARVSDSSFGVMNSDGCASILDELWFTIGERRFITFEVFSLGGSGWLGQCGGFDPNLGPVKTENFDKCFVDLNGDGRCEVILSVPERTAVYEFQDSWAVRLRPGNEFRGDPLSYGHGKAMPFVLPADMRLRNSNGSDGGVRLVDLNDDAKIDVIFSGANRYGIWLFNDMQTGWSIEVMSGRRGEKPPAEELPPIVREDGTDNGFFIHSGYLLWQNEDTANLPDMVEKRSIAELLGTGAEEE